MYQEIRNQEKAGEPPLTDEQIALKEVVAGFKRHTGYIIDADEANGVHEKEMTYNNMDGIPMYCAQNDGVCYYARDEKVLDEFLTKLEAADTNANKTVLFKKYAKTKDPELARCLAQNTQTLNAATEDIVALVEAHGADVINELDLDIGDKAVVDAVVARAREIYTSDKGNLENAVYLGNVMDWIDKFEPDVKLTEEEKKAIKPKNGQRKELAEIEALNAKRNAEKQKIEEEIAKTYFTEVKDDKGSVTGYTFAPSRIPTKEEMAGLMNCTNYDMNKALGQYTKLKDMGKGRYNEVIEQKCPSDCTVPHYAELVDKMESKEDVMDFIDNRVATDKNWCLPYDKILEKFPDDKDIKKKLFEHVDEESIISKKTAEVFIDMCGKNDVAKIGDLSYKNPDAAKARIVDLVKTNASDNAFIQEVVKLNDSLIPFEELSNIDASKAKWDNKTKAAVFEKCFDNRVLVKEEADYLDKAVKNGLVSKVAENRYSIGDVLYNTDWSYGGADGKSGTEDDTVALVKMSKSGYEHGQAMYGELKGYGSGNIAKMLRGKNGEGYEKYVTPNNVVGIIYGFSSVSKDMGIMEHIASEYEFSSGVKPGKALCNRIPKALMKKAAAMNLQDSGAYKAMKEFFGCSDDGKFTFNKNDEEAKRYGDNEAKQLDGLINDLAKEVLKKSGV